MMMALASSGKKPAVLWPGGVTLLPESGEDAGKVQTIGVRFAHDQITLEHAAEVGCRACASPGGGCQFLGTAATSQVVGEALGLSLPHTALAPRDNRSGSTPRGARLAPCCGYTSLASESAMCLRPRPFITPWWCMRPSADRRTC